MKNKWIAILLILAVIIVAWTSVIYTQRSKEEKIKNISSQIQANTEVGAYKSTISLYKEIISLDGSNIDWYKKYAQSYYNIGKYKGYEDICNMIIKKFPNQKDGYQMLLKYFSETSKHAKVISTYKDIPDSLKNDSELKKIYKLSEWQYSLLSWSYDYADMFSGGYSVIGSNGVFGYADVSTNEAIAPKFEIARPFIGDKAAVYKDKEWYFIDTDGDKVLATKDKIEDLYSFSEGYAAAKIGGKCGYVDKNFNKYYFDFEQTTNFYNGVAAVKKNGKWAIIDNGFKKITDFIYDDIVIDNANLCSRKKVIFAKANGKYHMLNNKGQNITNETFEDARLFYDNLAAVKNNGKWGFVNREGKLVIKYKYDDAKSFNYSIASVKLNDEWGYINDKDEVVVDYGFEDAFPIGPSGITVIKSGKRYHFIQFIKYR